MRVLKRFFAKLHVLICATLLHGSISMFTRAEKLCYIVDKLFFFNLERFLNLHKRRHSCLFRLPETLGLKISIWNSWLIGVDNILVVKSTIKLIYFGITTSHEISLIQYRKAVFLFFFDPRCKFINSVKVSVICVLDQQLFLPFGSINFCSIMLEAHRHDVKC